MYNSPLNHDPKKVGATIIIFFIVVLQHSNEKKMNNTIDVIGVQRTPPPLREYDFPGFGEFLFFLASQVFFNESGPPLSKTMIRSWYLINEDDLSVF